jgi:hypothetical protein
MYSKGDHVLNLAEKMLHATVFGNLRMPALFYSEQIQLQAIAIHALNSSDNRFALLYCRRF